MKKSIVLLLTITTAVTTHESMGMMRNMLNRIQPLHVHCMTPVIARRLYTIATRKNWPDYTGEQVVLIRDETLKANHLKQIHADDQRTIEREIEAVTAGLCPQHRPSSGPKKECSTCYLPQKKAYHLVSDTLRKRAF